ncbi:MAG: hypothetical protein AB2556_21090, partial [Candidatus Thiodiazotropha sp.]
ILEASGKNIKKAKGVRKATVKKHIRHEQFKEALFEKQTFRHGMDVLRSERHRIYGQHFNKVSLSPFDSKRWIAENGVDTLAYGHKDADGCCSANRHRSCWATRDGCIHRGAAQRWRTPSGGSYLFLLLRNTVTTRSLLLCGQSHAAAHPESHLFQIYITGSSPDKGGVTERPRQFAKRTKPHRVPVVQQQTVDGHLETHQELQRRAFVCSVLALMAVLRSNRNNWLSASQPSRFAVQSPKKFHDARLPLPFRMNARRELLLYCNNQPLSHGPVPPALPQPTIPWSLLLIHNRSTWTECFASQFAKQIVAVQREPKKVFEKMEPKT